MLANDLETALRRWGWAYGEQIEREPMESDKTPAVHPIARAMEYGHRNVNRRLELAYKRTVRRGERVWSRDPVPCKATRGGSKPPWQRATDVMGDATKVQQAWLAMREGEPICAEALRLQYQVRSIGQAGKAKRMGMCRNTFRTRLAEAKLLMASKLGE